MPVSGSRDMISAAFKTFFAEAPQHAKAWMEVAEGLSKASALDAKTRELAYLAVLAAVGLESGVPFHVGLARQSGASREEVISAILVGLPAAGAVVTRCLPAAVEAYDAG
jgi:AhpD family alkylhydroperoxidase